MNVMVAPSITQKRLRIQYISQLDNRIASFSKGDCGPACVLGFIHTCTGKTNVTVDDVAKLTPLVEKDPNRQFTRRNELRDAAKEFGVTFTSRRTTTLKELEAALDEQHGVILLVYYKRLPHRFDPGYDHGHWITLHGYNAEGFFYDDPYWPLNSTSAMGHRGEDLFITRMQLERAMQGGSHADVPLTGECLVLESHQLPLSSFVASGVEAGISPIFTKASEHPITTGHALSGTVKLNGVVAGDVVVQLSGQAELLGGVPEAITAAPSDAVQWQRVLTGYSGDLYRAYQQYGVTLMTWERFAVEAAEVNPSLVEDGYQLLPEKFYVMPERLITLAWSRPENNLSGTLPDLWESRVLRRELPLSLSEFTATFLSENGLNDGEVQLDPTQVYLLPEPVVGHSAVQWDKTMTGIEGTLDEVYNNYVAEEVPGLSRAAFRQRVVEENPILKPNGKAPHFYRSKSYVMPRAQEQLVSYLTTRTDAKGVFEFPNLPAGEFTLELTHVNGDGVRRQVTVPTANLKIELAPVAPAVDLSAPALVGVEMLQPVAPSFIRVQGQQFRLDDNSFRFVGVNTRGLVHWGDHGVLQHTFREQWDEHLHHARHTMGARVIRFFLAHHTVGMATTHNRLKALLQKLAQFDLYAVIAFTDVHSDMGHVVPGDMPFYTVQKHVNMLNREWYVNGYKQNYRGFVEATVAAFAHEPRIMAWELGNELKPFDVAGNGTEPAVFLPFAQDMTVRIRNLDKNHLITTGFINSGSNGIPGNTAAIKAYYDAIPHLSYLTVHFFEHNGEEQRAEKDSDAARTVLNMPLVVEESGFDPDSSRVNDVRTMFTKWFDHRNAAGVMQWGFLGVNDNGDGDGFHGLIPNKPEHFWKDVANEYRARSLTL